MVRSRIVSPHLRQRPPALTPMRILWLKSDLLLPLDKGGKLRTWHLMRHLARRHRITYLSFADPDQPPRRVSIGGALVEGDTCKRGRRP